MTDKVDPVQPPDRLWFRGDCHIHSTYSDGEQTPPEVAETARLRHREVDVIGGLVDAHAFECWVSESAAGVYRWTVGIRSVHYSLGVVEISTYQKFAHFSIADVH